MNLPRTPWTIREEGEANEFCILGGGTWLLTYRLNGELVSAQQRRIGQAIEALPDLLAALERIAAIGDAQETDTIHDQQVRRYSAQAVGIARAAIDQAKGTA